MFAESTKRFGGISMGLSFSYNRVDQETVSLLKSAIGENNVSSDEEKLLSYSHDEVPSSAYEGTHMAELLVFPETAGHVSEIMKIASAKRIPVTPRGAGTGLSGGALPALGTGARDVYIFTAALVVGLLAARWLQARASVLARPL